MCHFVFQWVISMLSTVQGGRFFVRERQEMGTLSHHCLFYDQSWVKYAILLRRSRYNNKNVYIFKVNSINFSHNYILRFLSAFGLGINPKLLCASSHRQYN